MALDAPARSCSCKHAVVHRLNCFFFRLGYLIGGFPRCTILCGLLFTCLCGIGLLHFSQESAPEKLWVPQDTRELRDKAVAEAYFPAAVKVEQLIVSSKSGDVANKASLLYLILLLQFAENVSVELDGEHLNYTNLCMVARVPNASYCHSSSVLDLFYDSSFELSPPRGYLETIKAKVEGMTDIDIKEAIGASTPRSWIGGLLRKDDILVASVGQGSALTCEAFRVAIYMRADDKARLDAWEEAWIDTLNVADVPGVETLSWKIMASRSSDDALATSLSYDFPKMLAGYALFVVYICSMLGRLHSVRMRVTLALRALLSILLALLCTAGVASACGCFWGPVHSVLPLLLFGIGADDAFVITSSFDRVTEVEGKHGRRERLALALSRAGGAITVTSLTNSCAFFVGAMTALPALRMFALWAGFGVLLVYMFQATFFVACLSLDARRQEGGFMDLACRRGDSEKADCCDMQPGVLRRFFEHRLAPFLLRTPVRIAVLLVTAAAITACSFGVAQLHQAFSPSLFYLDGTYVKEFHVAEQQHFPKQYYPAFVHTGKLAYESKDVQHKLLRLCSESTGDVARSSITLHGSVSCWYSQMRHAFNLSDSEFFSTDSFYPRLQLFLSGAGARFRRHLSFDGGSGSGQLNATRFALRLVHLESSDDKVKAMHTLQAVVDSAGLEGAFPFASPFTFFAQYALLQKEALMSVGSALLVVFVVTVCMIGNPLVCFVVFAGVAATVVEILGLMHFWEVHLNSVSMICLAVAVGLSVDFSAHIGLEFMEAVGTRAERVTHALEALGPSLVHGGTSTVLVVSLLVVARSYIFRVFFKMLFLTLSLGMFHGLVFVPVVLSWIGPEGFYQSAKDKQESSVRISITDPHFRLCGLRARSTNVAWHDGTVVDGEAQQVGASM